MNWTTGLNEMAEHCKICGEDNAVVLQEHHLVPRRLNGSDGDENLVTLCANCHTAVEAIYDDEFWDRAESAVRRKRDGPYVSSFTEREVCAECLREFNPNNDYISDREPQSPLYE